MAASTNKSHRIYTGALLAKQQVMDQQYLFC